MLFLALMTLDTDDERDRVSYLYEKYKRLLGKVAYDILRSYERAEDAIQETFLSAILDNKKILCADDENFLRWSVIIIKNKCFNMLRKDSKIKDNVSLDSEELAETIDVREPIESYVVREDEYEQMRRCLARLDYDDRQFIEMKYVREMSLKEIGKELGLTAAQVGGKLNRARAKIRKMMDAKNVAEKEWYQP